MASRFALLRESRAGSAAKGVDTARKALMIPALLAAIMMVVGFTTARMAGIDWSGLSIPYLVAVISLTIVSTLVYVFIAFARLARVLADNPISWVWNDIRAKAPMLLLPAVVFPVFLIGFTTAKTGIPFLVGFRWDAFWTNIDRLIFGDDAWRVAHSLMGTKNMFVWETVYSTGWAACLLLYKANVALYAKPRRVGVIYTAMLMTWLVGGWFLAYVFSAAGPVFAHLGDPALAKHFHPLRAVLDASLSPNGSTRLTQAYLANAIHSTIAVKGGGISAMPSMHVAAVSIFVLSARGTKWLGPAISFWIIIFFGSAYFGYHYWIDGIVAAIVAGACWVFAEFCFREDEPQACAQQVVPGN